MYLHMNKRLIQKKIKENLFSYVFIDKILCTFNQANKKVIKKKRKKFSVSFIYKQKMV